jgi:hypothetical protein
MQPKSFRLSYLFVLLLLFPACAPPAGDAAERSRRGAITLSEIEGARVSGSAYDLVQNLRPEWLVLRGTQSMGGDGGIAIYVNDQRVGYGNGTLRGISAQDVRRMERLDARIATNRYGGGHLHGAILITSR